MGIYSTIVVSRETALTAVLSVVKSASNLKLAEICDTLFGDICWHNFIVAESGNQSDDDVLLACAEGSTADDEDQS